MEPNDLLDLTESFLASFRDEVQSFQDALSKLDKRTAAVIERIDALRNAEEEELPPRRQVPYLSQWGTGADIRQGDCGPASVAMIVHHLTSHRPTVDEVAASCGQPTSGRGSLYTGYAQLKRGALAYDVTLEVRSPYTEKRGLQRLDLGVIREFVTKGLPVIALVHYGVLRDKTNGVPGIVNNQDQTFTRGHFFDVVDFAGDDPIVNDPDYWKNRVSDGEYRRIPVDAFEAALKAVAPGCTVGYQGAVVSGRLP